MDERVVEPVGGHERSGLDRRAALRLGLLTAGGLATVGGGSLLAGGRAAAGTGHNLFRGARSQSNDSAFSNSPELVTYAATNVRGGLWVHNADDGSVENAATPTRSTAATGATTCAGCGCGRAGASASRCRSW
ncbi:MAG TPA: hypothetical protein VHH15_06405 [Actinophytocola sp.]|nr:hypothetical protein [Actinophytocola sp.]